mmetsp:Transcript_19100/g.22109  ORF Transcript_19100/g.22109 Transcript_19100/m.22109 type:complete len:111 (+) Transcript_19100:2-334(+)
MIQEIQDCTEKLKKGEAVTAPILIADSFKNTPLEYMFSAGFSGVTSIPAAMRSNKKRPSSSISSNEISGYGQSTGYAVSSTRPSKCSKTLTPRENAALAAMKRQEQGKGK